MDGEVWRVWGVTWPQGAAWHWPIELPGAVACGHTTLDYDLWLSNLSSAEGSNVAEPARLCGSAVEGVRLTG